METKKELARQLATWFGCGNSPKAPGTVGSLGAVPLHLLLCRSSPQFHMAAVLAATVVGTWSAQEVAQMEGEEDPQSVVIDEVVGVLISMGITALAPVQVRVLAWLLFRAYDIAKPGPIDSVQRLRPAGIGIMADDILAGLAAGVTARSLGRLLWR